MSRKTRRLVAAVLCVCGLGLLTAGAAFSGNGTGTYGPGSWFFDHGDGNNAIVLAHTSTSTSTTTAYQAQVQQPINANGSSVWLAKKGVIPVQFTLQQATDTTTTTTTTAALYPDTLTSDGTAYPGVNSYGGLVWTPPSGLTVGELTNLTAYFTWLQGTNQAGSMRWTINTPDGNVYLYYGEPMNTGTADTGVNMITDGGNRVEISQLNPLHSPLYDTWTNALADSATGGTLVSDEPVNWVQLVIDSGTSSAPEQVQLSDVQITANGSTSEYVPGTVDGSSSSSGSLGPWSSTTSPAMYIDVVRTSGSTTGTVDETTYTGVGDSGGQFSVVDSKYKYNLSSNSLGAGTYQVSMDSSSAHNSPITLPGTFVLK